MRIVMDVDGVVADFTNYLITCVGSSLRFTDVTRWQVLDLLTPTQKREAEALLETSAWWETQPLMPGAVAGVAQLRDAGHDLVWATAPWLSCEGWDVARRTWLEDRLGVPHKDVVICSRKELVWGEALVDDKVANVESWAKEFAGARAAGWAKPFLFDAPYNQESSFPRFSWTAIPKELL
jgi:5'(3')-deoxyribonucleotidase